ncbi:MAG: glycosyltransferase [Acidobacteriota bacterium]
MARRVLVVSPEPLRRVRAGVAIRLVEIARRLHGRHAVTLAAPAVEEGLDVPFAALKHSPPSLASLLAAADVAIVHGHVGNDVLDAAPRCPLIFDLYDPFLVENLAYAATLGPAVHRYDLLTLRRQVERGDFFLCASEEQRAFYLGMLALQGRINPATYAKGRDLRHLLAVVPFGVPTEPAPARHGELRARLGTGDAPLVFYGGIYDWYDPFTAIDALELLRRRGGLLGTSRLLLVRNPNAATTPQELFSAALDRARAKGLGDAVVVLDWIPYEERGWAFAGADAALVTHRDGIETDLSFRTRLLDFLWAGLPVVATSGGGASALVARAGGGRIVPTASAEPAAQALGEILADPALARSLGEAGQSYAREHLTWDRALEPLVRWLEEPTIDIHKPAPEDGARRGGLLSRVFGGL